MTSSRDPDRMIHAFLLEGEEELHDQVYDAVRAVIEQKPHRAGFGPWRELSMNKFLAIGLGAAAVVAVLLIGSNLLGSGSPAPGSAPSDSAEPSQVPSEPAPSAWTGLEAGPFAIAGSDVPVPVTVEIATPGWSHADEFDFVGKNDDSLDPPESVGVALIAWSWPAGTGFFVYEDPCQWSTSMPDTPATTPDAIAAAFASQAETNATAPADVEVGGYAGKAITLTVPMTYYLNEDATREEEFAACDQGIYGYYGDLTTEPARNAQGPGQIDELWILEVNGSIVILDATYGPEAPAELIDEVRTLAESATFE